jgi:hypothetical protein
MDSGQLTDREKVEERKYGKTEANTSGFGTTILRMEEGALSILMAMPMKENGLTTKPKAKEYMSTWMVLSTSEIGWAICTMGMELKPGQTKPNTTVLTTTERSTAMESSSGRMDLRIQESFIIIIFTVKVSTLGATVADTKEPGKQTKCMAMATLPGATAGNILVNISKIKRKGMESLFGQTEDATEVNGQMGNNMEKDNISLPLDKKNTANGKMEKD